MFYFVAHINQVDHDDSKKYKGSIFPPASKTSREVANFTKKNMRTHKYGIKELVCHEIGPHLFKKWLNRMS